LAVSRPPGRPVLPRLSRAADRRLDPNGRAHPSPARAKGANSTGNVPYWQRTSKSYSVT
jgi:hypothetical protein